MKPKRDAADDAMDPFIGTVIQDRYRVHKRLAIGGMGSVYVADQIGLNRRVALKILDVPLYAGSSRAKQKEFIRRFELEASLAAQLSHPNIVVIHDYGKADEGVYYIAMEFIRGRTVHQVARSDGLFGGEELVHVSLQAAASLEEAHHLGMVHRDLKPSNLILTKRGLDNAFLKLVDFGLVKDMERGPAGDLTKPGMLMGSPNYMAPEQVLGQPVEPTADIYGLGGVMYFMATGKPPFDRKTDFEVLKAHVSDPLLPMREVNPECRISSSLETIIAKCLAKKTQDRFSSMRELAEALAASGEPLRFGVDSSARLMLGASRPPPALDDSGFRSRPPDDVPSRAAGAGVFRDRRSMWAAAVLVLFTAAGLSFWAGRGTSESGDPAPTMASASAPEGGTATATEPRPVATEWQPAAEWRDEVRPQNPRPRVEAIAPNPILLESDPPGAIVSHDADELGETPLKLQIPRGETWTLTFTKPGFEPITTQVTAGQELDAIELTATRIRRVSRRSRQVRQARTGDGRPDSHPNTRPNPSEPSTRATR